MNAVQYQRSVLIWLGSGAFLVALMVVIGGITRLTHSGLSMVDWKLFMGAIPPMNEAEWNETFLKYQQYPEFKLKHTHFNVEDFKSIFFWEYLHRMIGRLLGLVFIVPFILFLMKNTFSKPMLNKLYMLFFLGAFQGFLGWFMVSSGLTDKPDVSHYRLAAHLISAFGLFCYIVWLMYDLSFSHHQRFKRQDRSFARWGIALLSVGVIQIIYGAFVAGLKAGLAYNTYPKMGSKWVAESVSMMYTENGISSLFENGASVQFIHRILAHIVVIIAFVIFIRCQKLADDTFLKKSSMLLILVITLQFCLGIATLIFAVPVWLGVLHQLGALGFLGIAMYYVFHSTHRVETLITTQ